MGALCSRSEPEAEEGEHNHHRQSQNDSGFSKESKDTRQKTTLLPQRLHRNMRFGNPHPNRAHPQIPSHATAARDILQAHEADINARDPSINLVHSTIPDGGFSSMDEYLKARGNISACEKAMDFDYQCRLESTPEERQAEAIIQRCKQQDNEHIYEQAPPRIGFLGQKHPRFLGDHFLSNVNLINTTTVLDIAQHMPKGGHLHVHFNACLAPNVLLDIAKGMDRMFITSDLPLVTDNDGLNYDRCEIQFSLMSAEKEKPGDLFNATYQPRQTMKFRDFLARFSQFYTTATADEWLLEKLMFNEEETHNHLQTASGAWEKFNGRTRMMKGLFNYETAYRKYTRLCLEDFVKDNIIYAEIRPNFMRNNQLYHDDGTGPIDNRGIMNIIIEEVERFQVDITRQGKFFGGLKVIYCTPRSFPNESVKIALDECLEFKKRWPQWIAGFDLVGEEAEGKPLKDFLPEFLQFQKDCRIAKLDIPFLFHCGETLDMGTDVDGNLVDALLLKSKRIGHGFALTKHPYIMQRMKEEGICLELCPISNEILGLTPRVSGHAMYPLLANNVHCTVSSDNGTLFRSSLSHDFYQVMAGKADMGIYGWKQLALWSLEHACLSESEYAWVLEQWKLQWKRFIDWVIEAYGDEVSEEA